MDIGVKAWVSVAGNAPGKDGMNPVDLLAGLLDALANGAAGLSGGKATPTELGMANSPMLAGIDEFLNGQPTADNPEKPPRAFLNWLLFDSLSRCAAIGKQFKYVPSGSGFIRVDWHDDLRLQSLVQEGLPVVKSGYLFVYVSYVRDEGAEGGEKPVFFDNLTVQHYTGPLTEETSYYPFGLVQAGISSKAALRVENRYKYNGIEFEKDLGLNVYDARFRELDAQTGRWWQIDPKTDEMLMWSTYASNYDNPIRFADPLGDTPKGCPPDCGGGPGAYLAAGFGQLSRALGSLLDMVNPFQGVEVHNNTEAKVSVSAPLASGGTVETSTTVVLVERSTTVKVSGFENFFLTGQMPFQVTKVNKPLTKVEQKNAFSTALRGVPVELAQKTTIDKNSTTISVGAKANTGKLLDNAKLEAGGELYYKSETSGANTGQKTVGAKVSADATFVYFGAPTGIPAIPNGQGKILVQQKMGVSFSLGFQFAL